MRWLVALLVMTTLAGCASDEAAPIVVEEAPCLVTSADDFSCAAGNATVEHLHDYWGGADRLSIVEATFTLSNTNGLGSGGFRIDPAPDHVIPQGASSVDVTFTWTDSGPTSYGNTALLIKTAADVGPEFVQDIVSGETVSFPSSNAQNDLPHQRLSSWQFWLRHDAEPLMPMTRFQADVTVQVEAVRGLEIPLYPGHPDRWDGAESITLLEDAGQTLLQSQSQAFGNFCMFCFSRHQPDDGIVVPHDTRTVEVLFTTSAGPSDLALRYHDATTREMTRLMPDEVEGQTQIYRIPVEDGGDGPYAKQSLWEFEPYTIEPVEDTMSVYTTYEITATALRV